MYGYILAGEVVGSGFGLLLADLASSVAGWRAALGVLSIPSIAAVYLLTTLREPARGGMSRLQPRVASERPGTSSPHGGESLVRVAMAASRTRLDSCPDRRAPDPAQSPRPSCPLGLLSATPWVCPPTRCSLWPAHLAISIATAADIRRSLHPRPTPIERRRGHRGRIARRRRRVDGCRLRRSSC